MFSFLNLIASNNEVRRLKSITIQTADFVVGVLKLLDDDVYRTIRHDDNLDDLLAVGVLSASTGYNLIGLAKDERRKRKDKLNLTSKNSIG